MSSAPSPATTCSSRARAVAVQASAATNAKTSNTGFKRVSPEAHRVNENQKKGPRLITAYPQALP